MKEAEQQRQMAIEAVGRHTRAFHDVAEALKAQARTYSAAVDHWNAQEVPSQNLSDKSRGAHRCSGWFQGTSGGYGRSTRHGHRRRRRREGGYAQD